MVMLRPPSSSPSTIPGADWLPLSGSTDTITDALVLCIPGMLLCQKPFVYFPSFFLVLPKASSNNSKSAHFLFRVGRKENKGGRRSIAEIN